MGTVTLKMREQGEAACKKDWESGASVKSVKAGLEPQVDLTPQVL